LTFAITDNDQGRKAESTSALDHSGAPLDIQDAFNGAVIAVFVTIVCHASGTP
jgi:hypothetical protein